MNNYGNTRPDNLSGQLLINRSGWGGVLMRASIRPRVNASGRTGQDGFLPWTNIPRRSAYQPRVPVMGPRYDFGHLAGANVRIENGG